MITRSQIKFIRSLHNKKNRREQGLFLVEGAKALQELLFTPGWRIDQLVLTEEFHAEMAEKLSEWPDCDLIQAYSNQLGEAGTLASNDAGLALVSMVDFAPLMFPPTGWHLLLDGVSDPGNLGTIIRTADWFGITQIVASEDTVEWSSPKVIAASMGSWARVRVHTQPLARLYRAHPDLPLYATVLDGTPVQAIVKPIAPGGLIIGSESHGIRPDVVALAQHHITITRIGQAESLNAGVAAGIIMHGLMGS